MKPKKCKICKNTFEPVRFAQKVCSMSCAIEHSRALKAKKEKKDTAERKKALKSRPQWLKEAQAAINRYVRLRDYKEGCISCNKPNTWNGQWHASHFRSVGAASAVRFNLWNIHKSCSVCNNWLSGNLSEYEPKLRAKIGNEKVDWLRSQNQRVNYSIEYLQRLKSIFLKKCKKLEKKLL